MKTRCPCCGAENSLDALFAHEDARDCLWQLAQMGGPMTRGLVQYLGLFRPQKSALSAARMAGLMAELLPDMQAGHIRRRGKVCPAPPEAWAYGFQAALAARNEGRLQLPLKSHGWLYEVIGQWRGQTDGGAAPMPSAAAGQAPPTGSGTLKAAGVLEGLRRD